MEKDTDRPAARRTDNAARLLEVIRTQTEIAKLGLDLGGVMALVAERSQALTRAAGAVVELAEGEDMVYRASCGIVEAHLGLRLKRQSSLSGLCVQQGRALRCDDSEVDARVDRDACRQIGLRSMIVVPLRHEENVVGVLKVLAREPHAFDDVDLQTLDLMSGLIAASMFHAAQRESGDLFYRATHDALTGLPNRALFFERLRHCLSLAQREGRSAGLLILDMDGLKTINDEFGHRAGDAALQEFAARLRQASRNSDTVARIGGDEFGVVLTRIDHPDGMKVHAERLSAHFGQPFDFEQRRLALDASIGGAAFPDDSEVLSTLLETADQAMYRNKRAKKVRES